MADFTYSDLLTQATNQKTLIGSVVAYTDSIEAQLADILSGVTIPPAVQAQIDELFMFGEENKVALEKALLAGVNP